MKKRITEAQLHEALGVEAKITNQDVYFLTLPIDSPMECFIPAMQPVGAHGEPFLKGWNVKFFAPWLASSMLLPTNTVFHGTLGETRRFGNEHVFCLRPARAKELMLNVHLQDRNQLVGTRFANKYQGLPWSGIVPDQQGDGVTWFGILDCKKGDTRQLLKGLQFTEEQLEISYELSFRDFRSKLKTYRKMMLPMVELLQTIGAQLEVDDDRYGVYLKVDEDENEHIYFDAQGYEQLAQVLISYGLSRYVLGNDVREIHLDEETDEA